MSRAPLRFLVAIDGSTTSLKGVDTLLKMLNWYDHPVELQLLNVQSPLSARVSKFIPKQQRKQFHNDAGAQALAAARTRLDRAKIPYAVHIAVGDAAETIIDYAHEQQYDQIVIGTRGLGGVSGLLLGSVAAKVLQLAKIPVLVVR